MKILGRGLNSVSAFASIYSSAFNFQSVFYKIDKTVAVDRTLSSYIGQPQISSSGIM